MEALIRLHLQLAYISEYGLCQPVWSHKPNFLDPFYKGLDKFWTGKKFHGSVFRWYETRGTVQVFEL